MHTTSPLRHWGMAAVIAMSAALTACATGPRELTTNVQTFANMQGVALPASYRMEVLPSQSQQPDFARIEAAAQQALQRVGLHLDPRPDLARLVVQIGASASQARAYHPAYDDWYYGPRFGFGIGSGWGSPYMGMGMTWMDAPPMVYYRSVQLVIRDPQTQAIVYETSAAYDEVRIYDPMIWDVLFDAALSDFPNAPKGQRQVRTTLTPLAPSTAPGATVPTSEAAPQHK